MADATEVRFTSYEQVNEKIQNLRDKGVQLPKGYVQQLQEALDQNQTTVEHLAKQFDKLEKKHNDKGLKWWIQKEHDPRYPLMRLIDKAGHPKAYIVERTNAETQQKFYVANRVTADGAHIKVTSNDRIEQVREHTEAYFVGISLKELSAENRLEASNSPEAKPVESKTIEQKTDREVNISLSR